MHWVLTLLGIVVGALTGLEIDADAALPGAIAAGALGWLLARVAQLGARVRALEAGLTTGAAPTVTAAAADAGGRPAPAAARVPAGPRPDAPGPRAPLPSGAAAPVAHASAAPVERVAPAPLPPGPRAPGPRAPGVRAPGPIESDLLQKLGRLLRRWLLEGNVPVKIGALVLFAGVAAALSWATEEGYLFVPIELRLALVALAAIGTLLWGWRNRVGRPAFGLSLQGLAIGVLLLTVFAAFRTWSLLPAGLALGLVVTLVAAAALLALLQDALWLALLGFIGGYLAPVLISTGSGNHVALFSYYALLNAAVFAIAWVRPWRALNLVGFGFTFVVGALWGWRYYQPENFASTEPFLLLFFAFYVAIPVLYALRQPPARRGVVDGSLVFGTPLLAFPLQAALLDGRPMLLAYSALAVALLYALLAAWLLRSRRAPLLGTAFAALSIGFATLAVPLALSTRWTAVTWALEGAALVWIGLRQRQRLPQLAGWLLQFGAAGAYLIGQIEFGTTSGSGEWPLLNAHFPGVLLMALAAFFTSWCHDRAGQHRLLVWPPFLAGIVWWHVAALREIEVHFDALDARLAAAALLAITAALAGLLRGVLPWPRLGWIVLYACIGSLPLALTMGVERESVFALPGALYWAALLAALLFGLAHLRTPEQKGLSFAHVAVLWTLAAALGTSLHLEARTQALGGGWQWLGLLAPLLLLLLASWRRPHLATWPLAERFARYRWRWWGPALGVLALAWAISLGDPGDAAPLAFVPLFNPLELLQLGMLLVAARFALERTLEPASRQLLRVLVPAAAFAFVSMAGLRAVHQLASDAPWSPWLLDHATAQTTLTVLWSILGVLAWVSGSRRRLFPVWLAGAILMGVVLAKLVLIDRQYMGNITGIVSFMAVGGLLVLVGRIAPTPPRSPSLAAGATP